MTRRVLASIVALELGALLGQYALVIGAPLLALWILVDRWVIAGRDRADPPATTRAIRRRHRRNRADLRSALNR